MTALVFAALLVVLSVVGAAGVQTHARRLAGETCTCPDGSRVLSPSCGEHAPWLRLRAMLAEDVPS